MTDGYLVGTVLGSSCVGVFSGDEDEGTEVVDTRDLLLDRNAPAVRTFVVGLGFRVAHAGG